jgi:endonuclease YncB( thermonuclease family)
MSHQPREGFGVPHAPSGRGPRRRWRCAVAFAALLAALASVAGPAVAGPRVVRVLDGDSVVLSDGRQIRYLGVNSPEVGEAFSDEARALNRRLVEGKEVRLNLDGPPTDRYGRTLAYVYVDRQFVNADLVSAGLAHVLMFHRLREEATLAARQHEARSARRGMWGPGGPAGPLKITSPGQRRARGGRSAALRSVTVCNIGERDVDLDGYRLAAGDSRFGFPRFALAPGRVALVVIGEGRHRTSRAGVPSFYWPARAGDRSISSLVLHDPTGDVIDRVSLR